MCNEIDPWMLKAQQKHLHRRRLWRGSWIRRLATWSACAWLVMWYITRNVYFCVLIWRKYLVINWLHKSMNDRILPGTSLPNHRNALLAKLAIKTLHIKASKAGYSNKMLYMQNVRFGATLSIEHVKLRSLKFWRGCFARDLSCEWRLFYPAYKFRHFPWYRYLGVGCKIVEPILDQFLHSSVYLSLN